MPLPQEAKAVAAELTHTCFRIYIQQKKHICQGLNVTEVI